MYINFHLLYIKTGLLSENKVISWDIAYFKYMFFEVVPCQKLLRDTLCNLSDVLHFQKTWLAGKCSSPWIFSSLWAICSYWDLLWSFMTQSNLREHMRAWIYPAATTALKECASTVVWSANRIIFVFLNSEMSVHAVQKQSRFQHRSLWHISMYGNFFRLSIIDPHTESLFLTYEFTKYTKMTRTDSSNHLIYQPVDPHSIKFLLDI